MLVHLTAKEVTTEWELLPNHFHVSVRSIYRKYCCQSTTEIIIKESSEQEVVLRLLRAFQKCK